MEIQYQTLAPQNSYSQTLEKVGLTQKLYGHSWSDFFPYSFIKDFNNRKLEITFDQTDYENVVKFIEKHHEAMFTERILNSPFTMLKYSEFKSQYTKLCVDHFFIYANGEPIGFYLGDPLDWETYYMRYINILPEYRGSDLSMDFYHYYLQCLKKIGVKKLEAHIGCHNVAQIKKFMDIGFIFVGQMLEMRWGAYGKFTKFFDEEEKIKFQDQFFL